MPLFLAWSCHDVLTVLVFLKKLVTFLQLYRALQNVSALLMCQMKKKFV